MAVSVGTKGTAEAEVNNSNCADAMGSGELRVFATPAMCALIERAAWSGIAQQLEPGKSTVGTKLEISHVSATPVGMKVRAEAEVTAVDGRRIVFDVRAYDDAGLIGSGVHERFIVNGDKFLSRTQAKLEQK